MKRRIVSILMSLTILCSGVMLTACNNREVVIETLTDTRNFDRLVELKVIEGYVPSKLGDRISGQEVAKILKGYFRVDAFQEIGEKEIITTEEICLAIARLFCCPNTGGTNSEQQALDMATGNDSINIIASESSNNFENKVNTRGSRISENSEEEFIARVFAKVAKGEVTLLSLSEVLIGFADFIVDDEQISTIENNAKNVLVRGNGGKLINSKIEGNLYILSQNNVFLDNIAAGNIWVSAGSQSVSFNSVSALIVNLKSASKVNVYMSNIYELNAYTDVKISSDGSILKLNILGSGVNIRLEGKFNEVEIERDGRAELLSGEVKELKIRGTGAEVVVGKSGRIESLSLFARANIYNQGEIEKGYLYVKGGYFTNLPKEMIGEAEILLGYKQKTGNNVGGDYFPIAEKDYPKIVLGEEYASGEVLYQSLKKDAVIKIEVESKSGVKSIEVSVSNTGVTYFSEKYLDVSELEIGGIEYREGVNTVNIKAVSSLGQTESVQFKVVRASEDEIVLKAPAPLELSKESGQIKLTWTDENEHEGVSYIVLRSEQAGKFIELCEETQKILRKKH